MQSREIIGEDRGIERKREREERINLLTHNEREGEREKIRRRRTSARGEIESGKYGV